MVAIFNYDNYPEISINFVGELTDENFNDFINEWMTLYLKKQYFTFVFDTKEIDYVPISYCFKMAAFIKLLKREKIQYLQNSKIIIHNIFIRRLLDLIFYIQPPIAPVSIIDKDGIVLSQL